MRITSGTIGLLALLLAMALAATGCSSDADNTTSDFGADGTDDASTDEEAAFAGRDDGDADADSAFAGADDADDEGATSGCCRTSILCMTCVPGRTPIRQ